MLLRPPLLMTLLFATFGVAGGLAVRDINRNLCEAPSRGKPLTIQSWPTQGHRSLFSDTEQSSFEESRDNDGEVETPPLFVHVPTDIPSSNRRPATLRDNPSAMSHPPLFLELQHFRC